MLIKYDARRSSINSLSTVDPPSSPPSTFYHNMSYQDLIGKTAPSIKLLNYDGESFTFTPGEKGIPTALFFYPESGRNGRSFFLFFGLY